MELEIIVLGKKARYRQVVIACFLPQTEPRLCKHNCDTSIEVEL